MSSLGGRRPSWRFLTLAIVALAMLAIPAAGFADDDRTRKNDRPAAEVETASDAAKDKLHPKLEEKVESGSNETVKVFVTVEGSAAQAAASLDGAKVAQSGDVALVVGEIAAQQLPKLAGRKGVVGVGPVEFALTGEPLGSPDPELRKPFDREKVNEALKGLYKREVPYSKAPKPAGSNFEELKKLGVLDAKTHNFVEAWRAGFTGAGVTVGVLDGGTDFGHPDLLGTWQTWTNAPDPGWNGWPKAFDPYGTLIWLADDSLVDQGVSWYTYTEEKTCATSGRGSKRTCSVDFATRKGPSRNFAAPDEKVTHTYTFPAGWSKSGTVRVGGHPDDYLLALYGERAAFLVTDPNTAGTYDTIYVDLDADYDFGDEKPVTKASPAAYRDMDGDSYTDLSGGLVYYISDGVTSVPGGVHAFGGIPGSAFAKGELVAWSGDYDPAIGGHGTETASNIVGQGVIAGKAPCFSDLETRERGRSTGAVRCSKVDGDDTDVTGGRDGDRGRHDDDDRNRRGDDDDDDDRDSATYPGAVIGGAPHAKLAPYGDIYFSFEFSTQLGYFLATRNGVDITSNSYGSSDVDNDGFDAASQEADVIHAGRTSTPLFSTGNGAPGYGTTAPPSPSAGIAVGASTQFGGTGWDSISKLSQVVDNDVMVWSNRGFGATGSPGVDVVADGSYSAGDITLNSVLDGETAWLTWGGTSRSTPVAVGATALIYQAWKQANGGTVPAGFYKTAKDILKSSSLDLGYDTTTQGAGSVDAGDAVKTALGSRARVSPNEWRVGDYRGTEYPVFTHTIAPGGSDTQAFTVNGSGWQASDRVVKRTATKSMAFSSKPLANESPYNFNAPDYLVDLSSLIRENRDADLMVVRLNYPRAQFDPNGDYVADQDWRLLTYSWTDIDRDGRLWRDRDGDGVVDKTLKSTSSNIDGFADIDFRRSEIDRGEYVRLMYHRAGANALQNFVRDPFERLGDGIFLGLQHSARNEAIPVTDFQVQVDFYENVDWPWVTTTPTGTGFNASIAVPAGTPYGMYAGGIVLTKGSDSMVVPVSVAVAAQAAQAADGSLTGAIEFGGSDVAAAQSDSLYNNGSVFGANDWTWRAESGDWRFFFFDVPQEPAEGSLFLTRTTWEGTSPYTDIDTLIFGRSENHFQVFPDSVFGAPYVIDTVGGSPNTNTGAGVWTFDTATGGAEDLVTAPVQEGLHAIALHQVGWQGDAFHTPFSVTVGGATVSPTEVEDTTTDGTGSFDVTFKATVDLEGLEAEAFGLSQPTVENPTVQQDDPDDPSSASVKRNVTIDHASRLTVETELDQDIDLFVVYDENGDGNFTNAEIVAASATGTGNEFVELTAPDDGNYQVWLQGWAVTGTPTAKLTIDAIQGDDLTVTGEPTGPVPAGTPVTLTVTYAKAGMADGDYFGELLLGPPSAPTALAVPITVTKTSAP
jgi:hypothetical protein